MSKQNLDSFAPEMRKRMAKNSGFLQCRTCGLIWFGQPAQTTCPETPAHGQAVRVVVVCRDCDLDVPIEHLAKHLNDPHRHHTLT